MLVIEVKDKDSINSALKNYNRKVKRTHQLKQVRKRKFFEKPSVARRTEILKAAYKNEKERSMEG